MRHTQSRITRILLVLLLLTTASAVVAAPPVKVESADPAEAEQATTGLAVTISGSGFDTEPGAVTAVKFLLPCTTEPCTDTGGVATTDFTVASRKKIIAIIDVNEFAIVDVRDIEVTMTRGRGGKGTTLFNVREKNNNGGPEFTTCNEAYFGGVDGLDGPCLDVNDGPCDLGIGNPERIKLMTEDCVTSETIVLPNTGALWSDGNIEDPSSYHTLTAVGTFVTSLDPPSAAVLTNAGHRATVRGVNIVIDSSVAAVGCEPGDLRSAVRFVLDEFTEVPDLNDPNRASLLYVNAVEVTTEGDPLCEAIEVARRQGYTDNTLGGTNDWKIYVSGNTVSPDSYVQTGIRFEGFKQQEDINPPRVDNNVVGKPDCTGTDFAAGIHYGPLIGRDFDTSSEALIEGNTVVMAGAVCTGTTGIRILGDSDTDQDGNVNNNYVTGGKYGVWIDADATTDSVNLKGNVLSGTGGVAGVCSDIPVGEKGKPNSIDGYAVDILETADIANDCP